jgi:hypothetical protein
MRLFSIIILVILLGSACATGYLLYQQHQQEESLLRAALSEGVEHQLDSALHGTTQNFTDYIKDFGGWDLVGDFVGRADKSWGDANIGAAAAKKGIDLVWLYNENLELVYSYSLGEGKDFAELPLAKSDLKGVSSKKLPTSFFIGSSSGALEVFAGKIEPAASGGKVAKPFGYIFVARRWTSEMLKDLSKNTDTVVTIEPAGWNSVPDTMSAVTFFRSLPGWDGSPVLTLKATKGAEILDAFGQLRAKMVNICLGYGAIVLLATLLLAWQLLRGRGIKPSGMSE